MASHLSRFFRSRRQELKLSLGDAARLLLKETGSSNVNKASRNIDSFENTGFTSPELLIDLANALQIGERQVTDLIEQDREEIRKKWEEWADTPITPHFVVREMATIYCERSLPESVKTLEEAWAYVDEYAKQNKQLVWLVWSNRIKYFGNEDGLSSEPIDCSPDNSGLPITVIGQHQVRFESLPG